MDLYDIELLVDLILSAPWIIFLMWIVFYLLPYVIEGYAIMCTGHKAKIDGDFMAFIPVARQLYQMKIADCPWWYIFFFGDWTFVAMGSLGLILYLIWMLTEMVSIIAVVTIVYFIANRVFTFFYYQKFYRSFGFNPNMAWLNILPVIGMIPVAGLVPKVFTYLIAFSNAIEHKDYVSPLDVDTPPYKKKNVSASTGVVVGIAGKYAGANFDMVDGSELILGRDPQSANIIFDQTASDISRRHCSIKFDGKANQYIVTDYSSTGTYLEGSIQIEKGQPKTLAKGTVIYLGGSKQNGFRLN